MAVIKRFWAPVLAVAMLLSACGDDDLETTASTTVTTTQTEGGRTTSSSLPDEVEQPIVLRADGLDIVQFGQPADVVMETLTGLIGSPPTDSGAEAEWVEFVGWRDLGLFVGFDQPASSDFTGESRFVGWGYGPTDGLGLATDQGIGIGATLSKARSVYGDRLHVLDQPDECTGGWTFVLTAGGEVGSAGEVNAIVGTLDRLPADDAQIATFQAGLGVGC